MTPQYRADQSIGRLISILHRQGQVYFQRKLSPYGLGHGQVPVLMHIVHHEGITQHEISKHFRLDKGSTSSLIKGLTGQGFVSRKQDAADRRVYRLYITEKTQRLLPGFYDIFRGWTEMLLKDFSEGDRKKAFELLNGMLDNTQMFLEGEGDS